LNETDLETPRSQSAHSQVTVTCSYSGRNWC